MRRILAVVALLMVGLSVEPPNPACIVNVPFHCDPPPKGR